ncbi:UDP-2,4-diacetamido-2,4,6-trideoxy-beta-L-altropyranose hydrolase [Rhodobacterales bacterium 52_120_T64]|nr:UDP-2,4-diacetamido-2,4,6-trideoxy-beta-L-altropyranose hydrolase [Rhodobacterales bacterium 52_120_T64]
MRIIFRTDASSEIGGGHLMRCLTLAGEAARRGHSIHFIVNVDGLTNRVLAEGHSLTELRPEAHDTDSSPPHADWLTAPWQSDAALTAKVAAKIGADWLVWDHYGLDARWVEAVRSAVPNIRVLALDDLDDRPLGSDIVLDPAHLETEGRKFPAPVMLHGSTYALLRPEFSAFRKTSLARRDGRVRKVMVTPGMMDAVGLAPLALEALRGTGWQVEVIMGSKAQSVDRVRALVAGNPDWTLTLDATDMASRMSGADLCIGAGGGTSWERCCLGLPTVAVAVANNQLSGMKILANNKAAVTLHISEVAAGALPQAVADVCRQIEQMSQRAAALCDGKGAERVFSYVETVNLRTI